MPLHIKASLYGAITLFTAAVFYAAAFLLAFGYGVDGLASLVGFGSAVVLAIISTRLSYTSFIVALETWK